MPVKFKPSPPSRNAGAHANASALRRALLVAVPAWWACSAARAQEAPRLKFRSRRAVCECSGDTDDEAIEQAAEKLRGKPAAGARPQVKAGAPAPSAPATEAANQVPPKPAPSEAPEKNDKPTTRRQTP